MSNPIIDVFERTASRFPDKTAIADEERSISFSELRSLALYTAHRLPAGDGPVGVMAHRDIFTVPFFFGAMYCGRCYVPIDPDIPKEKADKIVSDAGIRVILSCCEADRERCEAAGTEFICIDRVATSEKTAAADGDTLCLIYTSGSTGRPKGVLKSASAMKSFIEAYISEFGFDENTVIGNQTPFCFDASAKDIYLMAATGARMEIIPTKHFSFPVRLMEYLNEREVSFISWVPSALSIVTALNTFSEIKPIYLKRVFFVGEVFPVKHLNRWIKALPDLEYVNLYGSSEICGISLFHRVTGELDKDASIPMGKPLSNCDVRLVDGGRVITEAGVTGEVYVASDALALEYFNDPDRTGEAFVLFDAGEGEKRYYRSGDVAKYNENGELVFAARTDFQIKHMGHRIELGEIETAADSIPGVDKCCCLYNEKRQRIVLYIQPEAGSGITDADVRLALKEKLSDYMLPHKYILMEALPLNQNGKTDRAALRAALK